MNLDLEGRTVVVTGAGSGIGAATVRLLLSEGAQVLAIDRNADKLERIAPEAMGLRVLATDVTDPETASRAASVANAEFGETYALVNGVGVAATRAGFLETSIECWRESFEVNLFAAIRMCRAFLPGIIETGGVIVNVASTSGRYPEAMLVDYGAAKAALLSMTGALAQEFGPHGVRAVALSPGPTRTELWERPGGFIDSLAARSGLDREAAVNHHIREVRKIALGRPGEAEDSANAIVFLCSPAAKHITGTNLAVHGGMATHLM